MQSIYAALVSPEVLILAGVVVLLFGSSQLPKLARSLGQAKSEFESANKDSKHDAAKTADESTTNQTTSAS